jgi:N-methylhydantoinase A
MLGCFLARELGMARIMIPRRPGVVSALGGLIADVKNDFVATLLLPVEPASAVALAAADAHLRGQAEAWLRGEQGFTGAAVITLLADMRYIGQSFEIEVPLDGVGDIGAVAAAFHRQHASIYDFADESAAVELVNLRLVIAGSTPPPPFATEQAITGAARVQREVRVWQDGAWQDVPLHLRAELRHGHTLRGPAIIVQEDTTVCIPGGLAGRVDGYGNIHLLAEGAA